MQKGLQGAGFILPFVLEQIAVIKKVSGLGNLIAITSNR